MADQQSAEATTRVVMVGTGVFHAMEQNSLLIAILSGALTGEMIAGRYPIDTYSFILLGCLWTMFLNIQIARWKYSRSFKEPE